MVNVRLLLLAAYCAAEQRLAWHGFANANERAIKKHVAQHVTAKPSSKTRSMLRRSRAAKARVTCYADYGEAKKQVAKISKDSPVPPSPASPSLVKRVSSENNEGKGKQ
jgi:hypothetical protein